MAAAECLNAEVSENLFKKEDHTTFN